jgi:hypothetical protein
MFASFQRRINLRRWKRISNGRLWIPRVGHDTAQHRVLIIPLWLTPFFLQFTLGECFCMACERCRLYVLLAQEYGEDFSKDVQQHHYRVRLQALQERETQRM